jgi:alcohol dehydrogenase (cytochrome c)
VKQTWARGLDARGRPIETDAARPSASGTLVYPGVAGGANWQSAAFHPASGLIIVPATEGRSIFTKSAVERHEPGRIFVASGAATQELEPVIRALDAATGQRRWEYRPPRNRPVGGRSGLLATAGDLVFGANEGQLFALDARTGEERWRIDLGGTTAAPPVSFALDGRQVVAIAAGRAVFLFGL